MYWQTLDTGRHTKVQSIREAKTFAMEQGCTWFVLYPYLKSYRGPDKARPRYYRWHHGKHDYVKTTVLGYSER